MFEDSVDFGRWSSIGRSLISEDSIILGNIFWIGTIDD